MGTVVSLLLPRGADEHDTDADAADVDVEVEAILVQIFAGFDRRYSLYRAESELSSIAHGSLSLAGASEELREVYAAALEWRSSTGGAFTPHRPDGVIDLNGIVKALAMQAAADALVLAGFQDWTLNVGGDVLSAGRQPDGTPWTVGIVDHADRATLLFAISLDEERPAVATSGTSERGDHIWRALAATDSFAQATVVASDIETADVLATAIVAGGQETLDLVTRDWAVNVLTVSQTGELRATPGLVSALAR